MALSLTIFLNGLGSVNSNQLTEAIKNHLKNTLNIIKRNPELIKDFVNPQMYMNQLEDVLQNEDDPTEFYRAIERAENQSQELKRTKRLAF